MDLQFGIFYTVKFTTGGGVVSNSNRSAGQTTTTEKAHGHTFTMCVSSTSTNASLTAPAVQQCAPTRAPAVHSISVTTLDDGGLVATTEIFQFRTYTEAQKQFATSN